MTIDGEKTFSSNIEVGTANLFVDTTTGRVGVGTGSPDSDLQVSSTGFATLHLMSEGSDGSARIKLSERGSQLDARYGFDLVYDGADDLGYGTNKFHILRRDGSNTGSPVMSILRSSGYVGINTTTPQYRLDVNGVARLNNVAFAAYRNQTTKDSSYTGTVVFNVEYFDQSGNYDTSTGLFTAPVAGIYHFSFNSYTNSGGGTVSRLFIYKNNAIYTQKGDEIDQHGNGIDVTIKLAVNDTVSLRGSGSYPVYLYASQAHNIFCGHLLTAV